MTALELYRKGELDAAIQVLGDELRSSPLDTKRRTFLFELLCFAGNYDRAEKQLDLLPGGGGQAAAGTLMYRSALHAERTRQELFRSKQYPEAREETTPLGGEWNGQRCTELRDADPRVGANLEVYIAGSYTWIPMKYMEALEVEKPVALRDLLWARARVQTSPAFRLQDLGEVLIPVLAPFSSQSADGEVRLGRATIWERDADGTETPLGQRMMLIDGEEVPLLEIGSLAWDVPDVLDAPEAAKVAEEAAMPLREDLLELIAGENPSGANLYYDKLFDQIKEARLEEVESGSAGAWERAPKRADHILVIKLAGDALAKQSKDLRLAGWLIESQMKREGIGIVGPGLDLLWKVQEKFWDTLYPQIDDDGDLGLRVTAIEGTVTRLATMLRGAPINKAGHGLVQYTESQRMGYEKDADTKEKKAARQDCIDQGQTTPEDFDASFAATPKSFYVATEESLTAARAVLDELDRFDEEKYGDDYPGLNKLANSIDEVKQVVTSLLNEKRKTEPDVVEVIPEPEPEPVAEVAPVAIVAAVAEPVVPASAVPVTSVAASVAVPIAIAAPTKGFAGEPETVEQACAAVLAGALYLHKEDAQSPAAYLVCAGVRMGETRREGPSPKPDFAVAPTTEVRQTLRKLANEASWDELMKLCLKTLTEPCGRAWLDLHRYVWRAARETSAPALAAAVVSIVRGLLLDVPEVRAWMLDDDTPVANAETQAWIDTEILPPPPVAEAAAVPLEEPVQLLPIPPSTNGHGAGEPATLEIYDTAVEMLKRGKAREAITLLVRDAELQPSGRSRFQRRVQVAQLCLVADQDPVAYPVLMELSQEIERRNLETWENGEMLAHPLSLLLTCLERRKGAAEHKEAVFERLCRLDPQAAMASRR